MRHLTIEESENISAGTIYCYEESYGQKTITFVLTSTTDMLKFNNFICLPNGCFHNNVAINPLKEYDGYRIVTLGQHNTQLASFTFISL